MERELPVPGSFLPEHVGVEPHVCSPPYQRLDRIPLGGTGHKEPPLGSVVYVTGRSGLAILEQLAVAMQNWPWIAPCAGLPPTEYVADKYAALDRLLRARLAVVRVHPGQVITAADVIRAVAKRHNPRAGTLAGWICARLSAQDLAGPLLQQFAFALGERSDLPQSVSSYSRLFREYGNLKARDWRAMAKMLWAHHAAVRQQRGGGVAGGDSRDVVLSPRTAGRYSVSYLGKTWKSALQQVGWEWVLECVLRRRDRPIG